MFLCMAFLAFAIGKVAYTIGYDNGYNDHSAGVEQPNYKVAKSSFEIEKLPEPGEVPEWKKMLNFLLKYWFVGCVAVAIWAFYMAATYPRRNVAKVKGEGNVIIQSHSGLYPPDRPI